MHFVLTSMNNFVRLYVVFLDYYYNYKLDYNLYDGLSISESVNNNIVLTFYVLYIYKRKYFNIGILVYVGILVLVIPNRYLFTGMGNIL